MGRGFDERGQENGRAGSGGDGVSERRPSGDEERIKWKRYEELVRVFQLV
jgi:hypothetical protein